jgi:glycogen synthase
MRILMTADTVGGVFTYAVELIAALEPHGVQTVLATFGRPLTRGQREQLRRCRVLDVYESSFPLEWMPNRWDELEASTGWLRDVVARVAPDCIHFNHFAHAGLPWNVPVVLVAHSCVWSWWRAVHGRTPGPELERYYGCVQSAIHAADRVVAPSSDMLASISRNYGLPTRSCVIPNGVDLDALAVRRKLPYVLSAGRLWDEAKNVQALEQIADRLRWPVYVAGEAVEPRGLAAYGSRRMTNCRPLGFLDRPTLGRCLARASIYALPARYEPFGLSILEAAASGCALVLGAIPSLFDNWGGAALFVDPENPEALFRLLEELIANGGLRERWGRLARLRASEFSAKSMAEHYKQLYVDVTSALPTRSVACA